MVMLRRNAERHHVRRGDREFWHSFFVGDQPGPLADGFGALIALDEVWIPPGDSTEPPRDGEAEIVIYVYRGALYQADAAETCRVLHAGEFQRVSTGQHLHGLGTSVARFDALHLFRISLRASPDVGRELPCEQRRFTAAERRNTLCVVASPDGRNGSLRIRQEALVHSTLLEPGHHMIHELEPGRRAWLHIVSGQATLANIVLTRGDGVGFARTRSVSITGDEHTEILLVDLGAAKGRGDDAA